MSKKLSVTFCLLLISVWLCAQVLPKEGRALNYRLVGFSFPEVPQVCNCLLEIAKGNCTTDDVFEKNIISTTTCTTNKIIAEVPAFGKRYTWRVVNKDSKVNGLLHHFSTAIIPAVDAAVTRLRVLKQATAYKDAYVFLDGDGVLYDMAGEPVWFLPAIDGLRPETANLRDIKLSPQGTITLLYERHTAYEVNYNGKVLWKAPKVGIVSGDSIEFYHHEFTRLGNGHYMILGAEYELWNQQFPSAINNNYLISHAGNQNPHNTDPGYERVSFGTIIEYDAKGKVVWSWRSSDYFRHSDLYYHTRREYDLAAHENSFYFDEHTHNIYVGFRNISRILKVKYPQGTVLSAYGTVYNESVHSGGSGLFCNQHNVTRAADGSLYLFNNNSCTQTPELPAIIKLQEPASGSGPLKKVWEYQCSLDGVPATHPPYAFTIGGNVTELPGGALFVNMSDVYSRVFIVNTDKQTLWSAIPERRSAKDSKWDMISNYRASIITSRKDLEILIWNAEKGK